MCRVFIIRKDLHLSAGKLAAMVGHCCEAYWTNLLKRCYEQKAASVSNEKLNLLVDVDEKIWNEYVNGIFTKIICEAKNLNQLKTAQNYIAEINNELVPIENQTYLYEGIDWGWINDKCLTELAPENPDGTTTIGIWLRPLPDEVAHRISKKFKLYKD